MKFRFITTLLIFMFILLATSSKVFASEKINIYFFYGDGCPHCAKEYEFLKKYVQDNKDVFFNNYEVWYDDVGRSKFIETTKKLGVDTNGVPFLVIGEKYLVGYMSEDTTGKEIVNIIESCRVDPCIDIFELDTDTNSGENININNRQEDTINTDNTENMGDLKKPILPKFGNIDLEKLSLPALTVALGFLDGFNPCAMWVLLFLISLLIGMEDKKKMWALGIAFILSSASVYFLFMVAWLNIFLFIGYISWVRFLIGVVAIAGGVVSFKKYLSKKSSGCDIVEEGSRRSIFDKLGRITSNKSFIFSLLGIIGLAFAVNLVELICSAGLPAVYTQILSLNKLVGTQYYLYIFLYILFFMLDDLFVFVVAMFTLQMTGITTKYVKYSRLIGGLLMLVIGILLIFKPEILMFG